MSGVIHIDFSLLCEVESLIADILEPFSLPSLSYCFSSQFILLPFRLYISFHSEVRYLFYSI